MNNRGCVVKIASSAAVLVCVLSAGWVRASVEGVDGGVVPMAEKQDYHATGHERTGEFELVCWQEGKEIFRESGIGQTFFGSTLNPQIVPLKAKDGRYESIQIIPFQGSLCRLKKSWR
ncbi:MAG: hypothetical protein HQL64_16875 [Magnetococcales bacterium]|nr:hypothetical protein [Magnetococcales bacterium]